MLELVKKKKSSLDNDNDNGEPRLLGNFFFFKFIEVSVAGKQNDLISEFDLY